MRNMEARRIAAEIRHIKRYLDIAIADGFEERAADFCSMLDTYRAELRKACAPK